MSSENYGARGFGHTSFDMNLLGLHKEVSLYCFTSHLLNSLCDEGLG